MMWGSIGVGEQGLMGSWMYGEQAPSVRGIVELTNFEILGAVRDGGPILRKSALARVMRDLRRGERELRLPWT